MHKNGKISVIIVLTIIFSTMFLLFFFQKRDSVSSYLLNNNYDVTEILFLEEIEGNKHIVFFRDGGNDILCAIVKKQIIGYKILRISGKYNLSKPGYICSGYNENNENVWVSWAVLTDKNITSVKCDDIEMRIVECEQYSYRICWAIGSGKMPTHYTEEYGRK